MLPEFYNQLVAMHGTVMIFLAVVPLLTGAFGNYLVPLHIGAPDMAFPRLNAASYWIYLAGGLLMLASFFVDGGAANSGWTSYAPLAVLRDARTGLLAGRHLPARRLLDAQRAERHHDRSCSCAPSGLTFMRLPFFVWAQLIVGAAAAARLSGAAGRGDLPADGSRRRHELLPAERPAWSAACRSRVRPAAAIRCCGSTCSGSSAIPRSTSSSCPAIGIVAEVIANNTRRPLWGYRAMVGVGALHRRDVADRLGAPHVPHRHGHDA